MGPQLTRTDLEMLVCSVMGRGGAGEGRGGKERKKERRKERGKKEERGERKRKGGEGGKGKRQVKEKEGLRCQGFCATFYLHVLVLGVGQSQRDLPSQSLGSLENS